MKSDTKVTKLDPPYILALKEIPEPELDEFSEVVYNYNITENKEICSPLIRLAKSRSPIESSR